MVEVEYRPISKIVVHEIIKYNLQEFIQLKTTQRAPVRWIDGIVFQFAALNPTPELTNEEVRGTVHWALFEFAEMPEFTSTLVNQATGVAITVIDNSNNTAVSDFIRWLRRQAQWFPRAGQ